MLFGKKFNISVMLWLLGFVNIHAAIDYLDTTYGSAGTGIVSTNVGTTSQANAIVIDSNGKTVVVGSTTTTELQQIVVSRYTTAGVLDATFGSGGTTITLPPSADFAYANGVAIDSNGKIVVVGGVSISGVINFFVARYTTAGVLDNTFATGGIYTYSGPDFSEAKSVVIDANGKIVLCGSAVISSVNNLLVARLTTAGALDTTFNTTGVYTLTNGTGYIANSVKLDQNAKIVAGGSATVMTGADFLVIRLNTNGTLDTAFGGTGIVTTTITSGANNVVNSISIDSSNNVVAVGSAVGSNSTFALARYVGTTGALDTTFNGTGIITTSMGVNSFGYASLIDSNGKIVAVGQTDANITAARYNANGSLDTTFGVSGALVTTLAFGGETFGVAIQADGRLVTAGLITTNQVTQVTNMLLVRYNKNNTDFVNLTTIADNSTITTKIPTISGTSNGTTSPQASVQVLVNGVSFATVNTDGSGNWNAGQLSGAFVLPVGANTIQTNLIVSSATVVSRVTKFTVADTFAEDSVFAYNTTNQTKSSNSSGFSTLPFNNTVLLGTWTYASNVFTCNKTGRYFIEYMGQPAITALGLLGVLNISTAVFINSTEYVGSGANSSTDSAVNFTRILSKGFIKDLTAGDTLSLSYAVTLQSGVTSTGGLIASPSSQGSQYPYSLAITRIG